MPLTRRGRTNGRVRRLLIIATAMTAAVGCVPPPSVAPSGHPVLAVVTWNMHAGQGDLRRLTNDLATGRLTGAAVPDFAILVQEAIPGGVNDIERIGRERHLFTASTAVASRPHHTTLNAILATQPLNGIRAIGLPRERQPRAAVIASLRVRGQDLFLVSAHLENRVSWLRGGLFSDSARGRQARALVRQVPAGAHGIAGGDLNTWLGPSEPAWHTLVARFQDTPPWAAVPTFRDKLVLDHLLFDLPDGWFGARSVVADRYGSDHNPVVGVVMSR